LNIVFWYVKAVKQHSRCFSRT